MFGPPMRMRAGGGTSGRIVVIARDLPLKELAEISAPHAVTVTET